MRKNVCSLIIAGEHYNVYLEDGAFIKENLETGELSCISEEAYEFYSLMSRINDFLLVSKGNDEVQDDNYEGIEDVEQTNKKPDFSDETDKIIKEARDTRTASDNDEEELKRLEAFVDSLNKETSSPTNSVGTSDGSEDIDVINEDPNYSYELAKIMKEARSAAGCVNSQDDEKKLAELEVLVNALNTGTPISDSTVSISESAPENEMVATDLNKGVTDADNKKGLKRIIKSRKSKIRKPKKEKVKKEKVKKEKPLKVKKVRKAKIRRPKKEKTFKIKSSRISRRERKKGGKSFLISLLALGLAGCLYLSKSAYDYYNAKNVVVIEENADVMKIAEAVIYGNATISLDVQKELIDYLNILYNFNLSDKVYENILTVISNMDFTNINSIGTKELENILHDNKNAPFIAEELYNYRNNISASTNPKFQLLANVLSFNESAVLNVLEGKDINAILKAGFNIDDNINFLTPEITLEDGENTLNYCEELKKEVFKDMSSSCELENNIFQKNIRVYDNAFKFYLYFDRETGKGISKDVYKDELSKQLSKREDKLDYSNVRDRELLYFYVNALLDTNVDINSDLASFIVSGMESQMAKYDLVDLMRFMSNSRINHSKAAYFYGLITRGEDALPLLQEVNMCLKMDLKDGLIDEDTYNYYLEQLYIGIEVYAPNMRDTFMEASSNNQSMPGYSLNLFKSGKI